MFFTAASLLVAGAWNLPRVLRQIWPYVAVLLSFVAFVVWNEGVVLGETVHFVIILATRKLTTFYQVINRIT